MKRASRGSASQNESAVESSPERLRFVLVEPRSGGNVGSAARALKNLGFSDLCLVRPRCNPESSEARRLAVDARDVLDGIRLYEDLDQALDGAETVLGTSARRGRHRRPHWRLDEFSRELGRSVRRGPAAVVFGRENHGLTDEELDRCTHLVYLPGSEAYPSFNLAHAVLLVAYELRLAGVTPVEPARMPAAAHLEREAMYRHLERALTTIGFLHPGNREVMMRRLRRLFGRSRLSGDEVRIVRGVARQTLWAAERAGLEPPDQADDSPEAGEEACR